MQHQAAKRIFHFFGENCNPLYGCNDVFELNKKALKSLQMWASLTAMQPLQKKYNQQLQMLNTH